MKKIFSSLAALLLIGAQAPASAEQWSFGPFKINAFEGYSYKEEETPAVFANANGSLALVSVHLLEGNPPPDRLPGLAANALNNARTLFERTAAKVGESLEAFSEQALPSGDLLATLPVVTRDSRGLGFFLQYAVVSNAGHVAIITVEGPGQAAVVNAALFPAIRSARFKR